MIYFGDTLKTNKSEMCTCAHFLPSLKCEFLICFSPSSGSEGKDKWGAIFLSVNLDAYDSYQWWLK